MVINFELKDEKPSVLWIADKCAKCGNPAKIITQTNIPLCDNCFDDYLVEHHGVRINKKSTSSKYSEAQGSTSKVEVE